MHRPNDYWHLPTNPADALWPQPASARPGHLPHTPPSVPGTGPLPTHPGFDPFPSVTPFDPAAPIQPLPTHPAVPSAFRNVGQQRPGRKSRLEPTAADRTLLERVLALARCTENTAAGQLQRTHVIVVLDASSSMLHGKALTLAGYNQQVDIVREQAEAAGDTTVTFIVFNNEVQTRYAYKKVAQLDRLTESDYRPSGSTALYDAVGAAIDFALEAPGAAHPETAVLVAVFTDGEENASRAYTGNGVAACVRELQATGRFTFTLMGPQEHLDGLADMLAIERGNIAGFDPGSVADRGRAMGQMTNATAGYMALRSMGVAASTSLYAAPQGNGEHELAVTRDASLGDVGTSAFSGE